MLALQKIAASFLSLPGLFILLWGIIVFYLLFKTNNNFVKIFSVLLLLIMFVFMSGTGVKLLLYPLENYPDGQSFFYEKDYPIVVLGGGLHYGLPDSKGELNRHSLRRLFGGYEIYQKLNTELIYTGGVALGHNKISEAELAEKWMEKMGVNSSDIVTEDQARTTYENGYYIRKWLEETDREKKIYLVTSAVHMPRSMAVFTKQGIEVIPVKAGYQYSHQLGWLNYLPNRGALNANLSAVHEWLGLVWYHLTDKI
ncbi:MAG: YdcF family protein [Bacillota bacterium]